MAFWLTIIGGWCAALLWFAAWSAARGGRFLSLVQICSLVTVVLCAAHAVWAIGSKNEAAHEAPLDLHGPPDLSRYDVTLNWSIAIAALTLLMFVAATFGLRYRSLHRPCGACRKQVSIAASVCPYCRSSLASGDIGDEADRIAAAGEGALGGWSHSVPHHQRPDIAMSPPSPNRPAR